MSNELLQLSDPLLGVIQRISWLLRKNNGPQVISSINERAKYLIRLKEFRVTHRVCTLWRHTYTHRLSFQFTRNHHDSQLTQTELFFSWRCGQGFHTHSMTYAHNWNFSVSYIAQIKPHWIIFFRIISIKSSSSDFSVSKALLHGKFQWSQLDSHRMMIIIRVSEEYENVQHLPLAKLLIYP
jgi:hypothetical protein